jgi:hypothetical protein
VRPIDPQGLGHRLGAVTAERAFGDSAARHFLRALRLRGKRHVVAGGDVGRLVTRAVLAFHRAGCAVRLEMHRVGVAAEWRR